MTKTRYPKVVAYAFTFGVLSLSSCAVAIYTPPALTTLDPHAATLAPGENALTGSILVGNSPGNPDTTERGGHVKIARGVAPMLEVGAELAVSQLSFPRDNVGGALADGNTLQAMARASGKAALIKLHGHRGLVASVVAGLGAGGISDVGSLASFDIGANIAYQNCILTPSLASSYYMSAPLSRNAIEARSDDAAEFSTYRLTRTDGVATSAALTWDVSRAKCKRGAPRAQVSIHMDAWRFSNHETTDGTGRAGAAFRYVF